jgi:hypothetical protein
LEARSKNRLARERNRIHERSRSAEEAEDLAVVRPTKESAPGLDPERWKPPISVSAELERSTSRGARPDLRSLGHDSLL